MSFFLYAFFYNTYIFLQEIYAEIYEKEVIYAHT